MTRTNRCFLDPFPPFFWGVPVSNPLSRGFIEKRKNSVGENSADDVNKDNCYLIIPTTSLMGNVLLNIKKAKELFKSKELYYSESLVLDKALLKSCDKLWFFCHGFDHYDNLDILLPNGVYKMSKFFEDNPDVKDVNIIFDVCHSSQILIDHRVMTEVIKRNIRLYTCGFTVELNTSNGSFMTYCLGCIQTIINKDVFSLGPKTINAWFEVISDITGYSMYCFGKDDKDFEPSNIDKQICVNVIYAYMRKYFIGLGIKCKIPAYEPKVRSTDIKNTVFY